MSTEELEVKPRDFALFAARFTRKPGNALVVGSRVIEGKSDRRDLYTPRAHGVDMLPGPGVDELANMEDAFQVDLMLLDGLWSHIDCVSVLEHSRRPWLFASNVERLMVRGATILLCVPFVWRIHAYPDDYFRFTPSGVRSLFPNIEWEALGLSHWAPKDRNAIPTRTDAEGQWMLKTEVWGFGRKR